MAVDKVDFRSPEGAAKEVNAWVQEQNSAAVGVMDCNRVRGMVIGHLFRLRENLTLHSVVHCFLTKSNSRGKS